MQPEIRRLSLWGLTYFWSQPQVTLKVTAALAILSLLLFFFLILAQEIGVWSAKNNSFK